MLSSPFPLAAADLQPSEANGAVRKLGGNRDVRIAYLVYREGLGPVFSSQVVTPLGRFVAMGYNVRLGVFVPVGEFVRPTLRRRWRNLMASMRHSFKGPISHLPSPPSRVRWAWDEAKLLAAWLRFRYGKRCSLILHCRGVFVTGLALKVQEKLPGVRVVYDCRGVEHAELELEGAPPSVVESSRRMEALAAQQSDAMLCVSHAMADFVVTNYGVRREEITVVPCCVDVERFSKAIKKRDEVRSELGLTGKFVVAYCGSLRRWQLPDRCLELFRQVKTLEPSAHYLVLTTQLERMEGFARSHGIAPEDVTILSLPYDRVAQYLAASDVGLLLRECSPINQVASPVKYAEYLASGLPVIMSEGIGDYSELTRTERVGLVLPHDGQVERRTELLRDFLCGYLAQRDETRRRCLRVARERLDSSMHLDRVASVYSELVPEDVQQTPSAGRSCGNAVRAR